MNLRNYYTLRIITCLCVSGLTYASSEDAEESESTHLEDRYLIKSEDPKAGLVLPPSFSNPQEDSEDSSSGVESGYIMTETYLTSRRKALSVSKESK
jgi:hypothetical protein